MSDLIRRDEAIIAVCLSITRESATDKIKKIPTAEPKEYVIIGTLTVQMPTIKEAKAVEKIVVCADTYKQEYYMPKVGKWFDHSEEGYVQCPFCGSLTTCEDNIDELHYCFNCGARMGGVADDD